MRERLIMQGVVRALLKNARRPVLLEVANVRTDRVPVWERCHKIVCRAAGASERGIGEAMWKRHLKVAGFFKKIRKPETTLLKLSIKWPGPGPRMPRFRLRR